MKMIFRLLILIVLFMTGVAHFAQNATGSTFPAGQPCSNIASNTPTNDLQVQQSIVAELKCLRDVNAGLVAERDALKGQVSTLTRMNQIEVERGDFYKDAATKGLKLDSNNGLIVTTLQDELTVCEVRNKDVEKENDKLRASRNLRTAAGLVIGGAIGYGLRK